MNTAKQKKDIQADSQSPSASNSPSEGDSSQLKERPNIFKYHQYESFLRDWIEYQKQSKKGFSLRKFSISCGLASGYLPMILNGQRPLSIEALRKIIPQLSLSKSETQFLECIHQLGTTNSHEVRVDALARMKKFSTFRKYNPNEAEVYEYLTKWYYFSIRELAADNQFKLDPEWIQNRLRFHVPLENVKQAITFLLENRYLEIDENGKVLPPKKHLVCEGGIYKISLSEYHKQLFDLAQKSIEAASQSERYLKGHTFNIPAAKYEQVRSLIDEVISKIQAITNENTTENRDSVYHMEMALFPLTKNPERKD